MLYTYLYNKGTTMHDMNFDKETACCFTGHRVIPPNLKGHLYNRVVDGVKYLYARNVKTFLAGGAVGFDSIASRAVLECRESVPDIRLILVIPCRDQAQYWNQHDKAAYEHIKALANGVICLSEHYYRGCMHQRNRYLVDNSGFCICYLTENTGGTAYTVGYARGRGLRIFNLARPKGVSV